MGRTIYLGFLFVVVVSRAGYGQLLTFDEPAALRLMTIKADWTPAAEYYSPHIPVWSGPDVTLTALGVRQAPQQSPSLYLRTRWLSQSPDEYTNVGGSLVQMDSTVLRIDLAQPTDYFGFGAALNATALPGTMTIDLFDGGGALLATRVLELFRTNGNAEGRFLITDTPGIRTIVITNSGAPDVPESRFGWVIDNLAYARSLVGPQGPEGPQGPTGDPADLPAGTVLFLTEGAAPPAGFSLVGYLQAPVHPVTGGRTVQVRYGVYVKR